MAKSGKFLRVKISEGVDKALREHLPARRGNLGEFVEKAIAEKLEREGTYVDTSGEVDDSQVIKA